MHRKKVELDPSYVPGNKKLDLMQESMNLLEMNKEN